MELTHTHTHTHNVTTTAILSPKREECTEMNDRIVNTFIQNDSSIGMAAYFINDSTYQEHLESKGRQTSVNF
jgi:hypothetical protein